MFNHLLKILGRRFDILRVVGGGCRNRTFNQFAGDAAGYRVIAGFIPGHGYRQASFR